MKRLIQRAAALTAALCLAAACMAPVYAETANTEKEENVYVSLAGDGSVADIYIVNMFALDGKTEIRDYGAYSSVRNLTSEADISLDGDSVTVSAEAGTFYYQGNLKDAQLPWNISVTYMLDGKNVAADELAGANGHLVISGSVTKNKLTDGDFYEAYMVQATVLLDTVKCRNIQTEGATEANVGADKQGHQRQKGAGGYPGAGISKKIRCSICYCRCAKFFHHKRAQSALEHPDGPGDSLVCG